MNYRWISIVFFLVCFCAQPVAGQVQPTTPPPIEYNAHLQLVRVDSGMIGLYFLLVETSSCGGLLGQYSVNISNAEATSLARGDLQYRNFQMFNDTCVREQVTYRLDGDELKATLKSPGEILILIMGQGRALVYTMTAWDKKTMLKLFQKKPKSNDIESTL